jgi:SagB-type dehydrogenase family enzyme
MAVRVRLVPAGGHGLADPLLLAALQRGVDATDVVDSSGQARVQVAALQRRCALEWSVDGAIALPLVPGTGLPEALPADRASDPASLSRFALLRRDEEGWLLESGRSPWRVRLEAQAVGLLPRLGEEPARDLTTLLHLAGMLDDRDEEPSALCWEPHDRYFVSRSRSDIPRPAEFRLAGVRPPEPARRADDGGGQRIALPVPAGPREDEPTLWDATESRRSVRVFADEAVPLAALGELLWRTLRVVRVQPADGDAPYERILRPVPSGGAMHATDLWLACTRVEGVPAGVWRYDPFTHELVGHGRAADQPNPLDSWLALAGRAPAPITGLLTARHARTSWKYTGIALSLELKEIGGILMALQVAAGAVGLGMCPWGSGPTSAIAAALGVDQEIDMPLGEFVLGVPAAFADPLDRC